MRWINKSNKIKKYWDKAAAKRKSKKEKQMNRLMKRIKEKEEKIRQEESDAEKYGKKFEPIKRGHYLKKFYGK